MSRVDQDLRTQHNRFMAEYETLIDVLYSNLFINGNPIPFILNKQQLTIIADTLDRLFTYHFYNYSGFKDLAFHFINALANTKPN